MKLNFLNKDKYFIIGYWIIIYSIFWLQAIPQTNSFLEATLGILLFMGFISPFCNHLSGQLLFKAIKNKTYKKFVFQFLLYSLIVGLIFILVGLVFHYLEQRKIFPESDYFDPRTLEIGFITVFYSAGCIINISLCGLRFFMLSMKNQKKIAEYQLQTLQHQVTPHFMFNVLNHIHILMQTNIELASDLLLKYSDILRYQLYKGENKKVRIEQDIEFLKDFIAVEEIRWQGKLTVSCRWEVDNPELEIPPLLFITFIENAFKYVSKSNLENGYINIDLEENGDTINFSIENSKSTLSTKKRNAGGLGLKNIKQRLDLLYFNKHSLVISDSHNSYKIELTIKM